MWLINHILIEKEIHSEGVQTSSDPKNLSKLYYWIFSLKSIQSALQNSFRKLSDFFFIYPLRITPEVLFKTFTGIYFKTFPLIPLKIYPGVPPELLLY